MLHEDHIIYAILLSQIKLCDSSDTIDEAEYDFLLSGGYVIFTSSATAKDYHLNEHFDTDQLCKIKEYTVLPCFSKLTKHIASNLDDWKEFLRLMLLKIVSLNGRIVDYLVRTIKIILLQ